MKSLLDLQAEFVSFRRTALAEIANLKSEVSKLKLQLDESHVSTGKNTVSSGEEKKDAHSQKHNDDSWWNAGAGKIDSITYEQAWKKLGGDSTLSEYVGLSQQIQTMVVDAALEQEMKQLLPRSHLDRKSYSTALINQKYVRSLEELYDQANRVYTGFDASIRSLADYTNGRAVVPPVKGEVRARMKALFKYRDENSQTDDEKIAWYRLTDLVRGTIEYDSIPDLYGGLKSLIEHFGRENVCEVNDRYQNPMPGGYRDIQCTIKFEGHVCELQLNTELMLRAKMTTGHRDFEVMRELKAAVLSGDLVRVMNSLEFGREHLGTDCLDGAVDSNGRPLSPLVRLIRSQGARTLLHEAAHKGDADIVHALLMYGADPDIQNKDGETALHLAVFGGNERCVWVLLDVGNASVEVKNNDGQTPLEKGYLLTWMNPTETAIRAVATLAHRAGADAVREARDTVHHHVLKMQKPSFQLVDCAACGRVDEMKSLLHNFADPNSSRQGHSALETALLNNQFDAVKLLLDFRAKVDTKLLVSLPPDRLESDQELQEAVTYVCNKARVPHVRVADGYWHKGILGMKVLEDGVKYMSNRDYVLKNIPFELQGIPLTFSKCHTGKGLKLSVTPYGKTVGVLIPHGARDSYGTDTIEEFYKRLAGLGFSKTVFPSMHSTSFPSFDGVDLWQLPPSSVEGSEKEITLLAGDSDFELHICLLPKPVECQFDIKVLEGAWQVREFRVSPLVNGVCQFCDRQYTWMGVPKELRNVPLTINPCHSRNGLKVEVSNLGRSQAFCGILFGNGNSAKEEYGSNYTGFLEKLVRDGFTRFGEFPEMYTTAYPTDKGAELWTLPIQESNSVVISTDNDIGFDMEFNILYLSSSSMTELQSKFANEKAGN